MIEWSHNTGTGIALSAQAAVAVQVITRVPGLRYIVDTQKYARDGPHLRPSGPLEFFAADSAADARAEAEIVVREMLAA